MAWLLSKDQQTLGTLTGAAVVTLKPEKFAEQAANNTREQFANSPDLAKEIMGAAMDALTAHTAMSKQALESEQLRTAMKDVLLGAGKLREGLCERRRRPGPVYDHAARARVCDL